MGCFWSSEAEERDRYTAYKRRTTTSSYGAEERDRYTAYKRTTTSSYGIQLQPRYGMYLCSCGRRWNSYRSWKDKYQNCKRCRRQVYAHIQRDLRPSDMIRIKPNVPEHQKEYCQMCQELGRYCGKFA